MSKEIAGKKERKYRASRNLVSATPFLLMLLIFLVAAGASYLVIALADPSHHPRLVKLVGIADRNLPASFVTFLYAACALPVLLQGMLASAMHYSWRKKGLLKRPTLEVTDYLNNPIRVIAPVVLPRAWSGIKTGFGDPIKTPDVKRTHWELIELEENRRTMKLRLRYVHDPLGRKPWQIRARALDCTVSVCAKGVNTQMQLIFTNASPMDYRTVREIIEETQIVFKNAAMIENHELARLAS